MEQSVNQHKINPITWAHNLFPLASLTVPFVGTNIEMCDMQSVTAAFLFRLYETTQ